MSLSLVVRMRTTLGDSNLTRFASSIGSISSVFIGKVHYFSSRTTLSFSRSSSLLNSCTLRPLLQVKMYFPSGEMWFSRRYLPLRASPIALSASSDEMLSSFHSASGWSTYFLNISMSPFAYAANKVSRPLL